MFHYISRGSHLIPRVLITPQLTMLWDNACSTTTGTAAGLFSSVINVLAATQCYLSDESSNNTLPDLSTFHFIIVGAGSAGSVVANRLSEVEGWNVLLLEAGPEPPIEADIPQMDSTLYGSEYDWQYVTQDDGVRHKALKNNVVPWPRGKMLGGSSSINAMFYVKCRDHDFQDWVNQGNVDWTPDNVTYNYKKLESFQNVELNQDPEIYDSYGHTGPLAVNTFNSTDRERLLKIIDSWDSIGIKKVPDINAASYNGSGIVGIASVTAANGQRQSTYRAYLKPASDRNNLKIVTNAFVTKILIDNSTKAYGVEVDHNGTRKTIYASLEVIISAGTVNTPQLLMLSGIGNKTHLSSKNIECLVDLPGVGQNLQDHTYTACAVYADESKPENKDEQLFDIIRYLYNKNGYLAGSSITDVTAFFSRTEDLDFPEFQSTLAIFPVNSTGARSFFETYREDVINSYLQYIAEKALYMFSMNILHPMSRGAIYLNTSDPYDKPLIYTNYFSDKRDIEALVAGMNIITGLLTTPYFSSINAFVHYVNISECIEYEFLSNSYWECYGLHTTRTIFHPVGTSKMGPDSKDAVVNNFLKVYGVCNLRIVDASIMPNITSGNTNAPTIMIGEMGSDMIKADYLV